MRIAFLMWPDTFEDWYRPLGLDRATYLGSYDAEWIVSVARACGAAGADVHLVFGTREEEGEARQASSGAMVHFVAASPAYRALLQFVWGRHDKQRRQRLWPLAPYLSTASPRLFARLRALKPDVVVVQDYEVPRYDVAALALTAARLPFVGLDTGGSAAPSRAPWKRFTARRARALLAAHGDELDRLRRERHPRRAAVWPVPVRTDLYGPADREQARARLGVDPATRIVLSVGRLHEVKRLPVLAQACLPLDCRLVLVGTGDQAPALAGHAHVHLTGRLDAATVRDWYAAADVVALASRQEGQPVAVLEAFACARGVVATAVGGVPDVVVDGETGWLVAPNDLHALRAALAEALADREECDRRGEEGRSAVLGRHSYEAAGRELLRLIA